MARCRQKTKVVSGRTGVAIAGANSTGALTRCFTLLLPRPFLVWKNGPMDFSAAERARRIRLILFDVDGVLTDGKIWILPLASVSQPR
jgi:hypothetical protein